MENKKFAGDLILLKPYGFAINVIVIYQMNSNNKFNFDLLCDYFLPVK